VKIGCFLSCEEFGPHELVDQARRAEAAGFHGLWISDHYHPWNHAQGHSPFVWSVIGAIAEATSLPVATAVTCPTVRIHPAIIAQAAATSSVMLGGRFTLGVGSGEALNEHILGDRWPEIEVRLEMLEEAVHVIRTLWKGGQHSHHGRHYTVENAEIFDLPAEPPAIIVSGFGPKSIRVAARIGDGYVTTKPVKDHIERYRSEGGTGLVRANAKVCFLADEEQARATAHRYWPTQGLRGELLQVLPTPAHFEQACQIVTPDMIYSPVGPDLDRHVAALQRYADAGADELYVQQIGPEQEPFFTTWAREVLPRFA
jgi:G6PDH family F420-dependent oxidoreductase